MKRKQLVTRTRYWQRRMGLTNWDIDINFKAENFEDSGKNSWTTVTAQVNTDDKYKLATIYYNPKKLHLLNDSAIVHELLHVICSPFVNVAYDGSNKRVHKDLGYFKEQMTAELERIIMRVYDRKN